MKNTITFQKINNIIIVKQRGGRPEKVIKDKSVYTRKVKHKKSI